MEALRFFAYKTPSMIWDAIYSYFSPMKGITTSIEDIRSDENYELDELYLPLRHLKIIQEAACYNQGAFSQYWFLASQKHKAIRLEYEKDKESLRLKELNTKLIHFLNHDFHSAALKNFSFMHSYFDDRDLNPPRICIKGYFHTEDKDTVITVFRDKNVPYDKPTLIGENTGFDFVQRNGTFYISNDIRKEAFQGNYKNTRLNYKKIRQHNKSLLNRKRWSDFWLDAKSAEDPSAYRSTLIVPMTFWNNSLSKDFLEALEIFPNTKRTVFGFLCIDHIKPNYFKKEADVSVAYYFADMLSQYLFSRLVYTRASKTINKVEKQINNTESYLDEDRIEELKAELAEKNFQYKSVSEMAKSSEEENFKYDLDESLIKYLKEIKS